MSQLPPPLPPSRDPSRPPTDHGSINAPPPPPAGYPPMMYAPQQPKRGGSIVSRIFVSLITSILLFSIGMNVYLGALFLASMRGPNEVPYETGDGIHGKRIVILPVRGMIDDRAAEFVHEAVKVLRDDPPAAIILRIESGGGSVSASDRIWHDLTTLRKDKNVPIVASYGGVAASGGYYISAPSDFIIAEPTCITGSIGVMGQIITIDGLLEKVGITPETLVATESPKKSVANDIYRPWNDEDRTTVRGLLDNAYERFVTVVSEGRKNHLTPEEVRKLANGSVYTAQQAVALKLIDAEGYLSDAIEKAKSLASLSAQSNPLVTEIHAVKQFSLSSLLGASSQVAPSDISADQIRRWVGELSSPRLEYTVQP